jgi:hypothetical protein
VALVLLPGYSYSDSIAPYYGQTGNAAANGLNWTMGDVLPTPPGLDINGVIYNYTINKQVDDSVTVHVQNEKATGTGYIFRETDEWRPGSLGGTQINKVVPVVPTNRELWGDGSIVTEGDGYVTEPRVIYTYKVDPCYNPQYDPNCPGYKVPVPDIPEVDLTDLYNALEDENVDLERKTEIAQEQNEENLDENEKKKKEEEEEQKRKYRLEKMMSASDAAALFAENQIIKQMNEIANMQANVNGYYSKSIPGGAYEDSVQLADTQLPDNRRGLRNNLAQQKLHQQMIAEQYK